VRAHGPIDGPLVRSDARRHMPCALFPARRLSWASTHLHPCHASCRLGRQQTASQAFRPLQPQAAHGRQPGRSSQPCPGRQPHLMVQATGLSAASSNQVRPGACHPLLPAGSGPAPCRLRLLRWFARSHGGLRPCSQQARRVPAREYTGSHPGCRLATN